MSKVAVITAASRGIGAATAKAFGRAGYDVVINYLHSVDAAKGVAKSIEASGQKAVTVQANVFTEDGVRTLFETVKGTFGHLDVLVNNAARPNDRPFGEWTQEDILKGLNDTFVSAVLCTQAAVPLMPNGGSILFAGSINGLSFGASPSAPLYSAAKAAVSNFAQSMAEKLAPHIRCNVVAPGVTKTPAWDGVNPEYIKMNLGMTLLKEWVVPEEIASAFVFLAETPHITAQTIVIDGGWQKKIRENSPARRV